jgi:hypothetical protein
MSLFIKPLSLIGLSLLLSLSNPLSLRPRLFIQAIAFQKPNSEKPNSNKADTEQAIAYLLHN